MKTTEKISKIFSGDAIRSASDSIYRLMHPLQTEDVLKSVDTGKLEELRAKYELPTHTWDWPKYINAQRWIPVSIRRAQDLRLMTRPKPLRILDLGSGGGFFLLVARHLGHSGVGMDISYPEMYGELFSLFGLERKVHRIEAFEPLPDLGEKFDMVTGFCVCFNAHKTEKVWGPDEWHFLLEDLRTRFLKPHGEVYFRLNAEPGDVFFPPPLRTYFLSRGAKIKRANAWIRHLEKPA